MIQIEDQRRPMCRLKYLDKGKVFEHGGHIYIKINSDTAFDVTDNTACSVDGDTEVYEVLEAVLCLN